MPTQRERDGPPAMKRGRGRIGSHTSTPRPHPSWSISILADSVFPRKVPVLLVARMSLRDFPAASAPLPEGHMTGNPSCWISIRRRDDGPNGRCWSSDVPMVERGRESWNGCSLVTAYPATAA